jgi:signal transduction histidine kinase
VLARIVERGNELSAETRDELLRVGYEQGIRLRHLLEQLLDLSRLDELSITVDTKPIVLRRVLAEIAAEAVPQPADVRIDVEADLAVIADPLVLDRIVSNLLVNAMRYGEPPIVLSADRRDQHTRIAVSDCGAGVPEELRPRLFERFARGEHAHGSGLGLAIARAYARAHGGDLVYEPGTGGARFEVILPNG